MTQDIAVEEEEINTNQIIWQRRKIFSSPSSTLTQFWNYKSLWDLRRVSFHHWSHLLNPNATVQFPSKMQLSLSFAFIIWLAQMTHFHYDRFNIKLCLTFWVINEVGHNVLCIKGRHDSSSNILGSIGGGALDIVVVFVIVIAISTVVSFVMAFLAQLCWAANQDDRQSTPNT